MFGKYAPKRIKRRNQGTKLKRRAREKRTSINILTDVYDYVEKSENNRYLKITICDQSRIVFNSIIKKIKTISGIDVLDVEHMSKKVIKSGTDEVPVEYCYTEITNENVNTL